MMKKETFVGAMLLLLLLSLVAVSYSGDADSFSEISSDSYSDIDFVFNGDPKDDITTEIKNQIGEALNDTETGRVEKFNNHFDLTVEGGASSYTVTLDGRDNYTFEKKVENFMGQTAGFVTKFVLIDCYVFDSMFTHMSNMKDVEIRGEYSGQKPYIENNAFMYLSSLKTVTSNGSSTVELYKVGNNAFYNCVSLSSAFKIESDIGVNAFAGCGAMKSLEMELSGDCSIGDTAFRGCTFLESVDIHSENPLYSVDFGAEAFSNCTGIKSVVIDGEGSFEIHEKAFYGSGSQGMTFLAESSTVLEISEQAFASSLLEKFEVGIFEGKIGDNAFLGSKLTELIVNADSSFVTIGRMAFSNVVQLGHVELYGITSIGDNAFSGDTYLRSFEIYDVSGNILTLGSKIFANSGLTEFTIFDKTVVVQFTEESFAESTSLISVKVIDGSEEVPLKVANMPHMVFANCSRLASINLEICPTDSNFTMSAHSFFNCVFLSSIRVTANSDIDTFTLSQEFAHSLSDLTEVTLTFNGSVNKIYFESHAITGSEFSLLTINGKESNEPDIYFGINSFVNNSKLSRVVVYENSKLYFGNSAFRGAEMLIGVGSENNTIGQIDDYAFFGCSQLETIGTLKLEKISNDDSIYIGERAFANCSNLSEINIDVQVPWEIRKYAFSGCSLLQSVDLSGCTVIDEGGFNKCSILSLDTSSRLPDLKILGKGVFSECNGLQIFDMSASKIETVPEYLFSSCIKIGEIYLPNTVKSIEKMAFGGCSNLKYINLNECTFLESIGESVFEKVSISSINLPDSITEIGEHAFARSMIISVSLPENLEKIGAFAFEGCQNLKTISIPDKVKFIGNSAFSGCSAMTEVKLPVNEEFTRLESSCFEGCTRLLKISIPVSVTEIGQRAFMSCNSLNTADFPRGSSLEIVGSEAFRKCNVLTAFDCSKVKIIGEFAFAECKNLKSIEMPAKMECELENNLFFNCSSLTSITIPSNVKIIGNNCFYGCVLLKMVGMPEGITDIGKYAFYDCRSLTSIYSTGAYTPVLESLGEHCFDGDKALHYVCFDITNVRIIPDYAFNNCEMLTFSDDYLAVHFEEIGDHAFCSSGITFVNIDNSLSKLGEYAFAECRNLKMVSIEMVDIREFPAHVFENCSAQFDFTITPGDIKVGEYAFNNCENLTAFNFSNTTIISLGEYAFANCTNINMGNTKINVKNIPDYAFYNCGSNVSLNGISNSEIIGGHAFEGCFKEGAEKELNLNNVLYINEYAFAECSKLKIIIGENVISIGNYAFAGCDVGNTIYFDRLEYIGQYAFTESQMESIVVVGSGNLVVDDYAFSYSKKLILGAIVVAKQVSSTVFVGCTNIESIFIDDGNVEVKGGVAYSLDGETLRFVVTIDVNYVEVEEGTINIAAGAFSGWQNILYVYLPESVRTIGDNAFSHCENLRKVHGLENVTSIGNAAFDNCKQLNEVELNANLVKLGDNVFRNCQSMETLVMSPFIQSVGNRCFENCYSLTFVDLYEVTKIYDYAFKGCHKLVTVSLPESVEYLGIGIFQNCASLASCMIPKGITEIPAEMFMGCDSIKNIVIPDYVVAINESAFQDSGVERVIMGDNVRTIKAYAFFECRNIVVMEFPRNLTTIEEYSFSFTSVRTITLPYSVRIIGDYAFNGCKELTGVTLRGSLSSIGEYAFADCFKLRGIVVSGSVTEIGKGAFKNCYAMTNASLPDSIVTIREELFDGCESLRSVLLGDGIVTIGAFAFRNCESLVNLFITENVKSIEEGAFLNCKSLISINIPISLERIEEDAYAGCISVEEITVNEYNTHFVYDENGLYSLNSSLQKEALIKYVENKRTVLIVDESVRRIDSYAIYNCDNLRYIVMNAVDIGDYCVYECDNLEEIFISDEVETVGDYFLAHCPKLERIELGKNGVGEGIDYQNGVLRIDDTIVTVDNSFSGILKIGAEDTLAPGALDYAKNITGFEVESNNPHYAVIDEMLVGKDARGNFTVLLKTPNNLASVTISQGLKTVAAYAISFCGGLKSIVVTDAVTFESFAVYSCPYLDKITINNGGTVFELGSICAGTASVHANVHIVSDFDYSGKIDGIFGGNTSGMIGYESEQSKLPIIIGVIAVVLLVAAVCTFVIYRRRAVH